MPPRSMTGFGAADGEVAGGRLRLEIRSVNHRHLSVQLKVPGQLSDSEGAVRERLRSHFDRGHVTVSGRWLEEPGEPDAVTVDVERARALVGALRKLGRDLKLTGKVDLATVARLPEVVRVTRAESAPDASGVLALLDRAAVSCVAAREREGATLCADLTARLDALAELARQIAASAPERLVRERDRLAAAVRELAGGVAEDYLDDQIAQVFAALEREGWTSPTGVLIVQTNKRREFLAALGEAFKQALEHGDK